MNALKPLRSLVDNVSEAFNPSPASSKEYLLYSFEAFDAGRKPFRVAESDMKSGKKIVRSGDVLFAKLNPRIPRAWFVQDNNKNEPLKLCSTEFVVLRAKNPRELDPEYLSWTLLGPQFLSPIQAQVSSSTKSHQRVRPEFILDQCVPVRPLTEQRRLVSRIKECIRRVAEMQHLGDAMAIEAKALEEAFLRERLAQLAQKTVSESLADLALICGGVVLTKGTTAPTAADDWLLVKVGDMNLPGNEVEISTAREYLRPSKREDAWPPGTIVLPKRGGAIATNKKRELARPAILDPNLMGIIADSTKLRPKFLLAQFLIFDLKMLTSGSTVPQLNRKDLAPLPFLKPTLQKQDEFIEEWNEFSSRAKAMCDESACAEELEFLRESILREAFAGNL